MCAIAAPARCAASIEAASTSESSKRFTHSGYIEQSVAQLVMMSLSMPGQEELTAKILFNTPLRGTPRPPREPERKQRQCCRWLVTGHAAKRSSAAAFCTGLAFGRAG